MRVGHKAPRALVGPFDRALELTRRMEDAEVLRHVRLLHAEGPADPVGHDAHLLPADAEDAGDVIAEPKDSLAPDMQCEMLPCRIVLGERGSRLYRIDDDTVAAQLELRDMSGPGEGFGGRRAVAEMEIETDIVWDIIVQ